MSGVFPKQKILQCWTRQGRFYSRLLQMGRGPELIWDGGNWNKRWKVFGVSQRELEGSGKGRRSMDDPAKWVTPGFTHILLYDQATCVYKLEPIRVKHLLSHRNQGTGCCSPRGFHYKGIAPRSLREIFLGCKTGKTQFFFKVHLIGIEKEFTIISWLK